MLAVMPPVSEESRAADFVQSCRSAQLAGGIAPLEAERYCGCALEQVETGAMWEMLSRERSAAEELEVKAMISLCQAMSRDAGPEVPLPPQ